jgi:hypothetical protein
VPAGRPSIYTDELVEKMCTALSEATTGLAGICDQTEEFPCAKVAWEWMHTQPGFRDKITRAKENQADFLAHQGMEILDGVDIENSPNANAEVNLARNRAEYRMKLIPKIAPRTMSDKQNINLGGQPGAPLAVVTATAKLDNLDEKEQADLRALARKAMQGGDE